MIALLYVLPKFGKFRPTHSWDPFAAWALKIKVGRWAKSSIT